LTKINPDLFDSRFVKLTTCQIPQQDGRREKFASLWNFSAMQFFWA
jgi:hypothetical protein